MKRINWLDTAKGIGIILVVLGHSVPQIANYIYWFHMPLFFFISGFFHKQKEDFVSKRVFTLMIPYMVYLAFLTIIRFLHYGAPTDKRIQIDMERFIFGGQQLGGFYTVFWYITCLLFTGIIFYVMLSYIKKEMTLLITILGMYLVSYYFSENFMAIETPWSIGVVPYALTFYYIGYKSKNFLYKDNEFFLLLLGVVPVTIFLYLDIFWVLPYKLNMKSQIFSTFGLDIIIPLSFIVLTIAISKYLAKVRKLQKVFSYLGNASLTIMYMHSFLLILFPIYFETPLFINIILSILIPLLFDTVINKFKLTNLLFNGKVYYAKNSAEMEISKREIA
ncbi:acyltransferase family protein [Metabacillus halosaccharovorans]|uniref:Acyltransferase family protein n=1 Tax=Metabacillus halosaccharovorans TaxID=930124 RepID=A0ABT3DBP2_9BACI|nr:acyltransferase family protein [Metabacillus halosaccharovorans]MCV9884479.1 acyltransferase family protein [Metabacillus halosaccharovorans]